MRGRHPPGTLISREWLRPWVRARRGPGTYPHPARTTPHATTANQVAWYQGGRRSEPSDDRAVDDGAAGDPRPAGEAGDLASLPFAANLLSSSPGDEPLVYGIYIGTILVANASMGHMEWMILRGPHLLHPDCEGQLGLFQSVLTTGLLLVALLLDVLVPVVNMYALLPIFAARPISVLRSRRLSRKRP